MAGYHASHFRPARFSIAVALALLFVCADAQGDLRISSTAGCPDAATVRARIEAAAKEPLPEGEIVIDRPLRFRARVRLDGAAERTIDGDDCNSLVEAAALVVLMSLHREAGANDVPEPNGPAEPAEPIRPAERPLPAPAPAPVTSSRAFFRVALLGEIATGALPSVAAGGRVVLGAGIGVVGMQIDGAVFASQTQSSPSGLEGDFGLASVGVRPCGHFAVDRIELTPCIGLSAFRFSASGRGTAADRDEATWALAPTIGLGTAWYFAPFAGVRVALEGGVLLGRPRFVIENDGPVHRPASLVGSVAVGPELRF